MAASAEPFDNIGLPLIPDRKPRSNRMGDLASPSPNFLRSAPMYELSSPGKRQPSTPMHSPPVPARSPLRPRPRAIVSSTQVLEDARNLAAQMDDIPNYATLSGLLESMDLNDDPLSPESDHRFSGRPDSPSVIPSFNDEVASLSTSLTPTPPTMSKRTHALLELLSSERAYASDLALIRDVHIPCALGQPAPFHAHPATPPSSGSSSRTLSTASDSSTSSSQMGPPMTREDTKIIFSNVAELAVFSDLFVERLEEALGSVLDGGIGDDHVGALFVEIIPAMEPPYKTYITRHPAALSHLHSLPPSSALTAYLNHSKTLATSLTHAWDLPSLLIKPVQRLLKYSLLLTAIIAETPETHPDKENLKLAREKMEDVARGVNEDRRRWEVVKEVLNTKPGEGKGKKGLSVPASVNIGRMRSLRGKEKEDNHEAEQVARMEKLLKNSDAFINQFAKEAVEWAATVKVTVGALKQWALGFAQVIGLSEEQKSEAFDAFVVVVEKQLTPLSGDLESIIHKKLLVDLARLVDSMRAPLRLLEAMDTLEPLHYGLLNINFAKSRPPTALLEASQSYLALRGQLFTELPQYLRLLDKGIATSIMQLAHWQTSYWADVHDRWGGLWDALRVDGEMNAGAAETSRVWWGRWSEVASVINDLNIVNPRKIYIEKPVVQPQQPDRVVSALASLNSGYIPQVPTPSPTSPSHSRSLKNGRQQSKESMRSGKSGKLKSSKHSRPTEDFNDYAYISMLGPMPPLTPVPSSAQTSLQSPGVRQSVSSNSSRTIPPNGRSSDAQEFDYGDQRGRPARKSSLTQKMSKSFRSSRSSSRKSIEATPPPLGITTFYTGGSATPSRSGRHSMVSSTCSPSYSLQTARAMYACRVVHPCNPPDGVSYRNLPFFTLRVNNVFDVLKEYGHPSLHEDLPLYVDDGEDCLLLVRDIVGNIGWSLASFLIPLD